MSEPLLEVKRLSKLFAAPHGQYVHAFTDVTLTIRSGETVGLVGESGSGKSSLGRCILRLLEPSSGQVIFDGRDITVLSARQMRPLRRHMQLVFQDPYSSLDPRMTVRGIVSEALTIHKIVPRAESKQRVETLLQLVGLAPEHAARFPHQFSGGQRQRIGIARALAVEPRFLIADEPVSALDVSVQAQILNLLKDLQQRLRLTLLFIGHDLAVVEHLCDRVLVMYLGRIMEVAPAERLYASPKHPYTEALLSAVPIPQPGLRRKQIFLRGEPPSALHPPSGCVFRTRCAYAIDECAEAVPALVEIGPGHFKACIRDVL